MRILNIIVSYAIGKCMKINWFDQSRWTNKNHKVNQWEQTAETFFLFTQQNESEQKRKIIEFSNNMHVRVLISWIITADFVNPMLIDVWVFV